jgi:Molecular chaperone GrpE (heat shock protein)
MSSKQQETKAEQQKSAQEPAQTAASGPETEKAEGAAKPESADKSASCDAAKVAVLETELTQLREELSSVNDKYLRKLADDVNFRKRMAREKEEGQRYAVSALLGDLIPILDDFDRAIGSAELQKDYGVLHDGVQIIRRQFGSVLESKYGLKKFNALGQVFDPNLHEAVAMIQDESCEGTEAMVAEEYLPGYGLHDRILRTAKVRVRMPSSAAQTAPKTPTAKDAASEGCEASAQDDSSVPDGAAQKTEN